MAKLHMFIYDCSRRLATNTQFVSDLERVEGVAKVIVVPEVQIEKD
jgi:hypothetical protein